MRRLIKAVLLLCGIIFLMPSCKKEKEPEVLCEPTSFDVPELVHVYGGYPFTLPIVTFSFKYREYLRHTREKQVARAQGIIDTLREMNFLSVQGEGYIPTYTRTDLTNNLHGSAGFRTDTQIVSKQTMKAIIAESKKSSKSD